VRNVRIGAHLDDDTVKLNSILPAVQRSVGPWPAYLLLMVLGLVESLLIIRIVLRFLDSNPGTFLVSLVYPLSYPFTVPFQRFVPAVRSYGSTVEWSSVVALVACFGLALAVSWAISVLGSKQALRRSS
jgi:hypothetical protein